MKYSELIYNIKGLVEAKGFSFVLGDIYEINTRQNKFPLMNVFVESVLVGQQTNIYTLVMYYVDRLAKDKSNEIIVQDNAIIYLSELINNIEPAIASNVVITPFTESFGDVCAGGFSRFELEIKNPVGVCLEY